jgi:hypothetical protein
MGVAGSVAGLVEDEARSLAVGVTVNARLPQLVAYDGEHLLLPSGPLAAALDPCEMLKQGQHPALPTLLVAGLKMVTVGVYGKEETAVNLVPQPEARAVKRIYGLCDGFQVALVPGEIIGIEEGVEKLSLLTHLQLCLHDSIPGPAKLHLQREQVRLRVLRPPYEVGEGRVARLSPRHFVLPIAGVDQHRGTLGGEVGPVDAVMARVGDGTRLSVVVAPVDASRIAVGDAAPALAGLQCSEIAQLKVHPAAVIAHVGVFLFHDWLHARRVRGECAVAPIGGLVGIDVDEVDDIYGGVMP